MSQHGGSQTPSDAGWEHADAPAGKGATLAPTYSQQEWAQWSAWQIQRMQLMSDQLTQQQQALAAAQQQQQGNAQQAMPGVGAAPVQAQPQPQVHAVPAIFDAQQLQLLQQSLTPPAKARKVDTPVLPDPGKNFRVFERAVEEHVAMNDGQSAYVMSKSLKDALPEHLRVLASEKFSIDEMKAQGSLTRIMDWLKERFDDLPDDTETETKREWENFRRTGTCLRGYIDQFEHHLVKLSKIGQVLNTEDQKVLLLLKADLPPAVEHEVRTALHRIARAQGQATFTYKDLKAEFLLLNRRPELLQRRVHVSTREDTNVDNRFDGRVAQTAGIRQLSNRRAKVNFGQKGQGKGTDKPCWHFAAGTCLYGRECKFSHNVGKSAWIGAGDGSRGRSRTPRGRDRGRDARDRSRSPRQSELCRLFQQGWCNFGASCKFTHASGGDRGRSAGRSRSPSKGKDWKGKGKGKDKFGKSRSRSPSWGTRTPSGRGAPDRSPRPPPKR